MSVDQMVGRRSSGLRQVAGKARYAGQLAGLHLRTRHRELTFRYRDRVFNGPSRRLFSRDRTTLDPVQARIVHDLDRKGIAFSHVDELLSSSAHWDRFVDVMDTWVNSEQVRTGIQAYRSGETTHYKDYIIRQCPLSERPTVTPDNPWIGAAISAPFLTIANSYLKLWSKLQYFDVWYTTPVIGGKPPSAAQNWHRDPEDYRMLKVFVYFTEVDAGAGPMQYIPGTRRSGGKYSHLWRRVDQSYPPQGEVERTIPETDRVTCFANPGTLVFCDTSGLHRGGYATERERVLATWTYTTPASLLRNRFSVDWSGDYSDMIAAARYALTWEE